MSFREYLSEGKIKLKGGTTYLMKQFKASRNGYIEVEIKTIDFIRKIGQKDKMEFIQDGKKKSLEVGVLTNKLTKEFK